MAKSFVAEGAKAPRGSKPRPATQGSAFVSDPQASGTAGSIGGAFGLLRPSDRDIEAQRISRCAANGNWGT